MSGLYIWKVMAPGSLLERAYHFCITFCTIYNFLCVSCVCVCYPGWLDSLWGLRGHPQTQRFSCLCLPSDGIKGLCLHCPAAQPLLRMFVLGMLAYTFNACIWFSILLFFPPPFFFKDLLTKKKFRYKYPKKKKKCMYMSIL